MENNTNLDPETRVAEGQGEGAKTHKHTNVGARVQVCVYVYWRLCQHVPYHTSIEYSYDMVVLAPAKFPSSKKLLTAIDLTPFMNS